MDVLELQPLIELLETDDRPSAVFSRAKRASGEGQISKLLYQNAAFRRQELRTGEVEDLLTRLGQEAQEDGNAQKLPVVTISGNTWRLRSVGAKWDVLICSGSSQKSTRADLNGNLSLEQEEPGSRASYDDSHIDVTIQQQQRTSSQDWTRYEVPNLSPWVDYVRKFNWASTALGPMSEWSEDLRAYSRNIMKNPNPRLIIWGKDLTFIYNEACNSLFGDEYLDFLGKPASVAWADVWHDIRPLVESALDGTTRQVSHSALHVTRSGFLEETYWDFTMLPITGADGHVVGILDELTEETKLVQAQRRRNTAIKLRESIESASSLPELWSSFLRGLEANVEDVPYALFYEIGTDLHDRPAGVVITSSTSLPVRRCRLVGTLGMTEDSAGIYQTFDLSEHTVADSGMVAPCAKVWKDRKPIVLREEDGTLPEALVTAIPNRAFGDTIKSAMVSPVMSGDNCVLGILITGLNPRCRQGDEAYGLYIAFLSDMLMKAASLISLPQEQRRAQKIAADMNNALAQQLRLITIQAERTEAKFSRMAASAPTGMFVFDVDERPLYVNDAYLSIVGQTREEFEASSLIPLSSREQVHPDDRERFVTAMNRTREQKVPMSIEYRLKKPWTSVDKASGQEISGETWMLINAFPDVDPDGKILSIQGWITDISYRKFTENLISRKLEDALENKRQSENFIDMTSHEMRNPLSAILQSADSIVSTLASTGLPTLEGKMSITAEVVEEIVDAAQTIILCAQHQKRIVDDILTLSKLDASLLVISPDRVQPPALIYEALKMYESEIARAGIIATLDIEPSVELLGVDWVVLDPSRLLQVVINLLTNAIKFTKFCDRREIRIALGASYERPTGKHHGVSFIPPRHVRPLQSPPAEWGHGEDIFLQLAVTDTGRGLNKDEMKLMFQRFSQASPKTYKQYGGSGLGLFISRELCELQGGQIGVSSGNGKTTFAFFVKAKRWVPETAQTRIQRPPITRSQSNPDGSIGTNRRNSFTLGNGRSLIQEQQAFAAAPGCSRPNKRKAPSSSWDFPTTETDERVDMPKLHVLIVEDNLINQKVMFQQLRRAGCEVYVANHGVECLSFLETTTFCSQKVPLSVILLDLEMPTMDGLTCIRHIRQGQTDGKIKSHVPVIAVTANARSEQIKIAIDAGMDQVVTKPFRIPELVPRMRKLIADLALRQDTG